MLRWLSRPRGGVTEPKDLMGASSAAKTLGAVLLGLMVAAALAETRPKAPRPAVAQPLALLFQVMSNITDAVHTRELECVHNEDMLLYSALTVLHQQSRLSSSGQRDAHGAAISAVGRAVADLQTVADGGEVEKSLNQLNLVRVLVDRLATFYDVEELERATFLASRYTCAAHPEVI